VSGEAHSLRLQAYCNGQLSVHLPVSVDTNEHGRERVGQCV
jgi:hypothetical protein